MNRPRCTDTDYVDFLVATPRAVSGTEAARVQPRRPDAPAHDAFTRLLHRLEPDPATLWHEVAPLIERGRGVLIVDDTTLDKPYAKKIELVHRHWSGKHHAVVDGINLITLVWSEGESLIPCDWRVFDKPNDGMTKNDHFGAMVLTAGQRGFTPECVLFDSWYASIDNLRLIRNRDWRWLTQLRSNRLVNPDRTGNRAVRDCMIAETGTVVHLKDYGMVKVFRIVTPAGDTEYWATNDLEMDEGERLKYAEFAWGIEVYHRALKQECGVERAMVRAGRAQRNHIGCAIRAFVRLEWHRLRTGIGWKLAKEGIIRAALRRYLAHPWYILPASA
jgi:putative transposase